MIRDALLVDDLRSISRLVVPEHHIQRAGLSAIDAQDHLPGCHERAEGSNGAAS